MENNFEIKSLIKVKSVLQENKNKWLSANSILETLEFSLSHASIRNILDYLCDQQEVDKMNTSAGVFYKLKGGN